MTGIGILATLTLPVAQPHVILLMSTPQFSSYNFADSQYIVRNRQIVKSEPIMFVVNDGLQSRGQDHKVLPGIE